MVEQCLCDEAWVCVLHGSTALGVRVRWHSGGRTAEDGEDGEDAGRGEGRHAVDDRAFSPRGLGLAGSRFG